MSPHADAGPCGIPDCATARGAKHWRNCRRGEGRSQGGDGLSQQIASGPGHPPRPRTRPAYGRAFDLARTAGVEAIGLVCRIDAQGIEVTGTIPMLG